jgi:hypothetical protein
MKFGIVVLLGLGGVTGCGTDPNRPDLSYFLAMNGSAGDTTAEGIRTFSCLVNGAFQLSNPAPTSGTVSFGVDIRRNLLLQNGQHFESTLADTSIGEAVLEYSGLGSGTLSFTLGAGPYTVSPPLGTPDIGSAVPIPACGAAGRTFRWRMIRLSTLTGSILIL